MTADIFLNELQRLIHNLPKAASDIKNSVACEYGDKIFDSRNLFNCFDCASCTDCADCYDSYMCVNCQDCDYCVETELCYECNDTFKCYDSAFLDRCTSVRNGYYSSQCIGCHDIFGCVNLSNKQFCIFNRQVTENEYKERITTLKQLPVEKVFAEVAKLQQRFPVTQTNEAHNVNTAYGDYIFYNTNCYLCFDAAHDEDCSYLYDSFYNKNVVDGTYASRNELSYEVVDCLNLFNCDHIVYSSNCHDSSYLFRCIDVKDSLGCVGLAHKQYCLLNRQLTKDVYEQVSKQIRQDLWRMNVGWGNIQF